MLDDDASALGGSDLLRLPLRRDTLYSHRRSLFEHRLHLGRSVHAVNEIQLCGHRQPTFGASDLVRATSIAAITDLLITGQTNERLRVAASVEGHLCCVQGSMGGRDAVNGSLTGAQKRLCSTMESPSGFDRSRNTDKPGSGSWWTPTIMGAAERGMTSAF